MSVLRDAGDAAKGDQRGRKGGFKSKQSILDSVMHSNSTKICTFIVNTNHAANIIFNCMFLFILR